jgi:hypothetical protein
MKRRGGEKGKRGEGSVEREKGRRGVRSKE